MLDITAAVTTSAKAPFAVRNATLSDLRDDEVLVKIRGSGICHTDLVFQQLGHFSPGVLGHEGAGIIERVGASVTKLVPGDHVVLSYYACHNCARCDAGQTPYCENGDQNIRGTRKDGSPFITIDGQPAMGGFFSQSSFASYAIAREENAVKVDRDLPLEMLAPLGCGFQTGAATVLNMLKVSSGESIVIFGTGAVGLAAVMAAAAAGANPIIAVDIVAERLTLAREFGATHIIKADELDAGEEIRRICPAGVAYAFEGTGLPHLVETAVQSLRRTGVCALVGVPKHGATANINLMTLIEGRSIRGTIEGDADPHIFIPQMIELYRQGRFPFDKLIRTYPLSAINTAIEDMESGRTVKPVLLPD